jgi:hypothetical protein
LPAVRIALPSYPLQVDRRDGQARVFDVWRRRWVALSPEEWVRQLLLHHLEQACGYPRGRIAVERGLTLHGMPRRADAVVFDPAVRPWMVVEVKAPDVRLDQAVLDQAARYNLVLRAPFLAVCNGEELLLAAVEPGTGRTAFLDDWPAWPSAEG